MYLLCWRSGRDAVKAILLPQRLLLPVLGEAHGGNVYIGEAGKKRLQMLFHIVLWGDDVYEPLQYAYIVEYTIRTNNGGYPCPIMLLNQHR